MMTTSTFFNVLTIMVFWGCAVSCAANETEVWQKNRDNIEDVSDQVQYLDLADIYISSFAVPHIVDDYMVIRDPQSAQEMVHIFDKNTFQYITSRVNKGRGPGEMIDIGHIEYLDQTIDVYVADHTKRVIYNYPLDSLINNENYIPDVVTNFPKELYIVDYEPLSDSTLLCNTIQIEDSGQFIMVLTKLNINTADVEFMSYRHPDIERPRISFATSLKHNMLVVCYSHHNLMTICDMDGNLKRNIYGDKWSTKTSNRHKFFGTAHIINDKIVAAYSDMPTFVDEPNGKTTVNYHDKLQIFDINGEYIKTLNLGVQIAFSSYDEQNHRLIFGLQNSPHQIAYLDLSNILE